MPSPSHRRAAPIWTVLLFAPALRAQPPRPVAIGGDPSRPHAVELRDDLSYSDAARDGRRNRLDLYLPRGVDEPPLVVFVHGGMWVAGSKERYAFVGRHLASRGIATAVVNYRLYPFARHPEQVEDCAAAFAFLHAKAGRLGFDRDAMFLMGHSAGGHIVALLALERRWLEAVKVPADAVRGVVTLSAPFDVRRENPVYQAMFGQEEEPRAQASPIVHVRKGGPPFLVVWASSEIYRLEDDSRDMVARLSEVGHPHRALALPDQTHRSYVMRIGGERDVLSEPLLEALDEWTAGK